MISIEQLTGLVEEATQSTPGKVSAGTELASLDGWDSMGLVVFVELVQSQVDVELAVHELRACATPAEVLGLIQRQSTA
jgi:acyl carrier protein